MAGGSGDAEGMGYPLSELGRSFCAICALDLTLGGSALDPSLLLLQLGFLDGAAASEEGGDLGVNVGGPFASNAAARCFRARSRPIGEEPNFFAFPVSAEAQASLHGRVNAQEHRCLRDLLYVEAHRACTRC